MIDQTKAFEVQLVHKNESITTLTKEAEETNETNKTLMKYVDEYLTAANQHQQEKDSFLTAANQHKKDQDSYLQVIANKDSKLAEQQMKTQELERHVAKLQTMLAEPSSHDVVVEKEEEQKKSSSSATCIMF